MSALPVANSQPSRRSVFIPSADHSASASNAGLDSAQLLNGQKAITIVHNGMPYRLQATKLGKLILTK